MGHDAELSAAAGVAGGGIISNGSATDIILDTIADWTLDDLDNGISSQDGPTINMYGGDDFASNNKAGIIKVLPVPAGDRNAITVFLDHTALALSTAGGGDSPFIYILQLTATHLMVMKIYKDEITLRNSSGVDVPVDSVTPIIGSVSKFTIDMTKLLTPSAIVGDFYYGNDEINTGINCAVAGVAGPPGWTALQQISRVLPYVPTETNGVRILYGDGLA